MGAELFHADGRTDMSKLTVAFHNYANAPKNNFNVYTVGLQCVHYVCILSDTTLLAVLALEFT